MTGGRTTGATVNARRTSAGLVVMIGLIVAAMVAVTFALAPQARAMGEGSIGDRVWFDGDGDGMQDPGELVGFGGVQLVLKDGDGNVVASTTTDSSGLYLFELLDAGTYTVQVDVGPAGMTPTTPGSRTVDLAAGQSYRLGDFGFVETPLGSIGGVVWLDDDGDGIQDAGELGLPGVAVSVITPPVGVGKTTLTDIDGRFSIGQLPAGQFEVEVGAGPTGSTLTTPATYSVTLAAGENDQTSTFGFRPGPGSMSGVVGFDLNGDGFLDFEYGRVSGVQLILKNRGGDVLASRTSASDGTFRFAGLHAGEYTVEVGAGPPGSTRTSVGSFSYDLKQGRDLFVGNFAFSPPPAFCEGELVTIDMNVNGGRGNGTPGADVIFGTPGNDRINGFGGDDVICAGGGDDSISGGDGFDTIMGGVGADDIVGGNQGDTINGGDGNDHLDGSGGWDRITGGLGDDFIIGGYGNDWIWAGPGIDYLIGGPGDDLLLGFDGDDIIRADGGNDLMNGMNGNDDVEGGDGFDQIWGGGGDDHLKGQGGFDWIWGRWGQDTIEGGPGNDSLYGEGSADVISGGPGDDVIDGGLGADDLLGNAGNDTISGGDQSDTVTAGPGDDTIDGGYGTDNCDGNAGTDSATNCEIETNIS